MPSALRRGGVSTRNLLGYNKDVKEHYVRDAFHFTKYLLQSNLRYGGKEDSNGSTAGDNSCVRCLSQRGSQAFFLESTEKYQAHGIQTLSPVLLSKKTGTAPGRRNAHQVPPPSCSELEPPRAALQKLRRHHFDSFNSLTPPVPASLPQPGHAVRPQFVHQSFVATRLPTQVFHWLVIEGGSCRGLFSSPACGPSTPSTAGPGMAQGPGLTYRPAAPNDSIGCSGHGGAVHLLSSDGGSRGSGGCGATSLSQAQEPSARLMAPPPSPSPPPPSPLQPLHCAHVAPAAAERQCTGTAPACAATAEEATAGTAPGSGAVLNRVIRAVGSGSGSCGGGGGGASSGCAVAADGSGTAASSVGVAAAGGSGRRSRPADPRRFMSRIKEAASLQDLSAVVRRITSDPDLAANPLLLVAALSKLARTAADPAATAAVFAATTRGCTAPPGASGTTSDAPDLLPAEVLGQLLPAVAAAVPKMRVGELASCVWSLGKLRPLWGVSQEPEASGRVAAGRVVDAVAERLALDWGQTSPSGPSSASPSGPSSSAAAAAAVSCSPSSFPGRSESQPAGMHPEPIRPGRSSDVEPSAGAGHRGGGGGAATRSAAEALERGAATLAPLWSQAGSQDVANLAWGLARCGRGRNRGSDHVYDSVGVYDGAWQWLGGTACDVLWSGQAREVANLVWAFATAGRPEPQVFDNLMTVLASNPRGLEIVRQLREEECTAVLWALATALGRLRDGAAATISTSMSTSASGGQISSGREVVYIPPPAQPLARLVEVGDGSEGDGTTGWLAEGGAAARGTSAGFAVPPSRGQEATRALLRLGERATDLAVNGKLTGRQTSSLLWSLVVLQGATGVAPGLSCAQALSRRAAVTARYMDGQALGNAAWALGRLRFRYGGAMDALCAAALSFLERTPSWPQSHPETRVGSAAPTPFALSQRDVVQLLWACGRLQHVDERLVAAAQARLFPDIPFLGPWALTTLAFALAALDCHATAPATLSALCKRAYQLLPPLKQQQPQQPQQPQQRPQEALVGHERGQEQVYGNQGAVLNASQVAALVSALGRTEHYDSGLLDEACERLRTWLGDLQPWEVCSVVSALGQLEHPHNGFLKAVEEAVVYDVRPYGPSDLACLLYGFASTGTRAERLFVRAAAVLQRGLSSLEPEAVTRLAESFAVMGLPDDDLFENIAALTMRRSRLFSQKQVERLALAFRSLGYQDSNELLRAWREGEHQR